MPGNRRRRLAGRPGQVGRAKQPRGWPKARRSWPEARRNESKWDEEAKEWIWTETTERRYYLSSLSSDAKQVARAVRSHWGIENQVHWVLDVSFGEDECQIRKGHAPRNVGLLRRIAMNAPAGPR